MRRGRAIAALVALACLAHAADTRTTTPQKGTAMFKIHAPAFSEGATIPKEYTCEGADLSPELVWEGAPAGTKSYVLICDDPDAPAGVWTHWVAFDIPGATTSLARGNALHPQSMKGGKGSGGDSVYHGPCPPRGHGKHRYYFTLYALDCATLGLSSGVDRKAVERAMHDHVLGKGVCMGRYERE